MGTTEKKCKINQFSKKAKALGLSPNLINAGVALSHVKNTCVRISKRQWMKKDDGLIFQKMNEDSISQKTNELTVEKCIAFLKGHGLKISKVIEL